MVRESTWQLFQYITAALLVFFLSYHILLHTPLLEEGYRASLEYESVLGHFNTAWVPYAILLYLVLFHGMNGLRGVLLELAPGYGRAISLIIAIIGILAAIYGTMTLVRVV